MAIAWDLPEGIVDLIGNKISSAEDVVRFEAVCKSWQSSVECRKKVPFSPWLMLATYDEEDHHKEGIQKFFSLANNRIFNLWLPQTQGRRCFGTSFGWVVTIGIDLNIHLLDPFTNNQLSLPPQSTFKDQFRIKCSFKDLRSNFVDRFMAFQSGPDQSCVVMAIHSEFSSLSFARPGDEAWTLVNSARRNYKDVILYNGEFYAIGSQARVQIIDISNSAHPKAIDFAEKPEEVTLGNLYYLVEMNGGLHYVERTISDPDEKSYTTDYIEVFEFDFSTKKWTYLYDLGDYALFLGTNTSYAVDTSEYPELRCNCIYYTDDHVERYENKCCDMGVYDYGEQEKGEIYSGDYAWSKFSRPIFFMPCL